MQHINEEYFGKKMIDNYAQLDKMSLCVKKFCVSVLDSSVEYIDNNTLDSKIELQIYGS